MFDGKFLEKSNSSPYFVLIEKINKKHCETSWKIIKLCFPINIYDVVCVEKIGTDIDEMSN